MTESAGNVTAAARKLGISRRTLHRKLKSYRAADAGPEPTPPSTENPA